jgi:hypothetical protein
MSGFLDLAFLGGCQTRRSGEKPALERPAAVKGARPPADAETSPQQGGQAGTLAAKAFLPPYISSMAEQVQSGPEPSRGAPFFRRGVREPLDGEDRSEIMGHGEEGKDNFQPTRGHVCRSFTVGAFVKILLILNP